MCSKRAHRVATTQTSSTIGTNREENFPAKCAPPLEASWLSPAHVYQGRSTRRAKPPPSGTHQAIRLIEPLRSRDSFAALSSHGRRRQGRWCWVRFAPFPDYDGDHEVDETTQISGTSQRLPEIGYAIGKKVGNAVVRNRIRRRIRPIVVAEADQLPPGIYLIGVKNDEAARISHEKLHDDLRTTLDAASRARR